MHVLGEGRGNKRNVQQMLAIAGSFGYLAASLSLGYELEPRAALELSPCTARNRLCPIRRVLGV